MVRNLMSRTKVALLGSQKADDVIRGLETTKASLEARIPDLEAAKAAALDERREALISGSDAADAARKAREAEDNLTAAADALAEVERRLSDAVAKRDADDVQAKREAAAKGLEADAKAITAAAKDIDAAVAAVAKAHARMMLAVSAKAAPQIMDGRPHLSPKEFADGVVLQAIVEALPGLSVVAEVHPGPWTRPVPVEGRPAGNAAADVADRLRDVAANVRAGVSGDLPKWSESPPSFYASDPTNVSVYATTCFSWIDRGGKLRRGVPGHNLVPEPVSDAAIHAGIGRRGEWIEAARAKAQWDNHLFDSAGRRRDLTPDDMFKGWDVHDLGVDLKKDREEAERRHLDEHRARQARERVALERRAA